jgi:diguanylate cyclase (GGDEF)-like protein/PAS domain S-box-containing protein
MRWTELSIRNVSLLVVAFAVVLTVVLGTLLTASARDRAQTNRTVEREVRHARLYQEAYAGVLGGSSAATIHYVLRDPHHVEIFESLRDRADAAFHELRESVLAEHPEELGSVDQLIADAQTLNDAERQLIAAIDDDDIARAVTVVAENDVLNLKTRLLDGLTEAIEHSRAELAAAQADDRAKQQQALWLSLAMVGAWGILLLVLAIAAFRLLIRPLERMSSTTKAIADGNLSIRVEPNRLSEFAQVASDVNRMTEALIKRSDELNAYLSKDLESRTVELEKANATIHASEQRFRSLVQHASDLVTVVDEEARLQYVSPAAKRILGYQPDEVLGKTILSFVHPDDIRGAITSLANVSRSPGAHPPLELRVRHANGDWRHVETTATNLLDDPAVAGVVHNSRDITERKELEEQLRHQAFHDPLTGLANRLRFMERLEHALERGARDADIVHVLFLDLDNFKSINDGIGHSAGDEVLKETAQRITTCLRSGDTAARLGGDEFAVLLEDLKETDQAIAVVRKIFDALRSPYVIAGREIFVRASVGLAAGTGRTVRGEELMRNADVAMYLAKSTGKNRFQVYEDGMHAAAVERLELAGHLQRALEHDEFVLEYQPTVELSTGEIVGFEALLRWDHPTRGRLLPGDFISLAEESGVIVDIGRWVLNTACRQGRRWGDTAADVARCWTTMSVNVSVRQLAEPSFVQDVADSLAESGFPPDRLVLEITETAMMQTSADVVHLLRELKALGLRLAIDDFGTGYSSLSYLSQFPFDILKMDKSFIDEGPESEGRTSLTRAIVDLGRTLDMDVLAEGIEQLEQVQRLLALNCTLGQGFYFARPLSVVDAERLLQERRGTSAAA